MATARIANNPNPEFLPVTLEVTLKSQAELDLFGTIFNYIDICDYPGGVDNDWCKAIRRAVKKAGGNTQNTGGLRDSLRNC